MKTLAFVAVCALALPGCTIAKIQGSGSKPLVLNQVTTGGQTRQFEVSSIVNFDYTNSFEIDDVLREEASGIDALDVTAAQNVRIEIKNTPANFFINLFTLGLANSRTVAVKGDLVVDQPID